MNNVNISPLFAKFQGYARFLANFIVKNGRYPVEKDTALAAGAPYLQILVKIVLVFKVTGTMITKGMHLDSQHCVETGVDGKIYQA